MKCVLGFDGGGTKTECVAMDLSGAITSRGRGPASNPTRIGFEVAAIGVKQAADVTLAALGQTAEVVGVCAGLAGTAAQTNHDRMQELLRREFPGIFVRVCTDLDLALAAMPAGWSCSACFSRPNRRLARSALDSLREFSAVPLRGGNACK